MHPNIAFRQPTRQQNIDFVQGRSFGVLVVSPSDMPLISHIPFQLSQEGNYLEAHLVRSNPIIQALNSPCEAMMVVSGGDAYISPDWYEVDEQVPTWNYVAVHLRGSIRKLEQSELLGVLERLSENMEKRLLPKPPWKLDKLSDKTFAKMSRQIVPIAMDIREIEGTWKLSQNKPDDVIARAAIKVKECDVGSETNALAKLMAEVSQKKAPPK